MNGGDVSAPNEELATQLADSLYDRAELLTDDDLTPKERSQVPSWWLDTNQLDDSAGMERALAQWDTVVPDRLSGTRDLFLRATAGLHLGRLHRSGNRGPAGEAIVLIYALHNQSDDADEPFICWYGYPPCAQLANSHVDLALLPGGIRAFYTQLHGYFHPAGFGSTGFIETAAIFPLDGGSDTWEFRNSNGVTPDTTKMVPIFLDDKNSVCIELGNTDDDAVDGWLLYGADLTRSGPVWNVIDERIVQIIETFDD